MRVEITRCLCVFVVRKNLYLLLHCNHTNAGFEIEEELVEDIEYVVSVNNIGKVQDIEENVNDIKIQEEVYITDVESTGENKDRLQHDSFEALVNDFDEIDDHIDQIIEDINESRYHSEEEDLTVESDDEISENDSESPLDTPSEGIIRLTRENYGTGVDMLEPTHSEKMHNETKKKKFLISEKEK